ncbi:MAG: hypothetical protein COB08_005505 [Rhodobacteraceae bacterium]|nr:hypothetical protein [Paracoccaceae bacterium]
MRNAQRMPEITYFFAAHSAFAYLGSAAFYDTAKKPGAKFAFARWTLAKLLPPRSQANRNYYFGREIERWGEMRNVAIKAGIPANHGHDETLANCAIIAADLAASPRSTGPWTAASPLE